MYIHIYNSYFTWEKSHQHKRKIHELHIHRDFYGELHSIIREAGIDGVKVDAQAAITMLGAGYGGGPQITRAYVHAMEQSVKENLHGNCINCMCHPTENLYSFRETSVAR